MRKSNFLLFSFLVWICGLLPSLSAQPLTQTVRGTVADADSKYPLAGVSVVLLSEEGKPLTGTNSDESGSYRLAQVPLGRQRLRFTYIGYQPLTLDNLIVTSAKELILPIEMISSSVEVEEVEIVAQKGGQANNEMAIVSVRQFSIEETNRYAGSRGEPARMASNYAGVQGADDSRNDIVIRGNSPAGLLWRLEGINIPNPNHFSIPGSAGGPVTILNNKFLANSDFFTGAFPAQYGNSTAGVFDLKMRNGNNEKHEFSGQFGFLGTELSAEGPLSKNKNASYLVMYRYSTLALFSALNINIGTDAVPNYQDGAFRFNFQGKKGGSLSLWGMGGLSKVDIVLSTVTDSSATDFYADDQNRDQLFKTGMGIIALTYRYPININTFIKASIGVSKQRAYAFHQYIYRNPGNFFDVDSLAPILDYTFDEVRYHSYVSYNRKLGVRHLIQAGIYADWYDMSYQDSVRIIRPQPNGQLTQLDPWRTRWDSRQGALLLQPFFQYKLRLQDRLDLTAGITSLYFGVNKNSFSPIEPRLGLAYQVSPRQRLSLGAGLHSQIQPTYVYFYGKRSEGKDPIEENIGMGLSKSLHSALAYELALGKKMRFKAETYYQYLYDIPVREQPSSYSLINSGSGFSRLFPDTVLVNEGTGRNYGLELTLERSFSQGYYFLLTGSLFDAKYQGSDKIWRNTVFNGRFAFNALVAKEFKLKNGSAFNIGSKFTTIGGRWYGPVDTEASDRELEIIYVDSGVNTLQFRPYYRLDLKVGFNWNSKKVSHELAIDLVNLLNTENILSLTYVAGQADPIRQENQLGRLPLFYYKIDF
ncbi:MAG: TonB-dependent receptor [Bacteroidetes bacterium]|nr:MAG: TonB-dependent receptor [Bacteroidota bacterium]